MNSNGQLYDIIKYEGPSDIFVWKHSCEDFNSMTQLIVHESQEAVFFKNGQALDLFGAGRYTLETQNIPILGKIANLPSNGETPFHCEIYFINKAVAMDLQWGTNAPISVQDPYFGIILPIRANGQFSLAVQDSRKLLVKLVGTISLFARDEIARYFKGVLNTYVKDMLAAKMVKERISFLEINSYLVDLSSSLEQQLQPIFEEYGLSLKQFFLSTVSVPEDDPGFLEIRKALAKNGSRTIQKFTYQDERAYDVVEKAASNEGPMGVVTGTGMGIGMGVGMGVPLGAGLGTIFNKTMQPILEQQPPQQQSSIPTSEPPGSGDFLKQKAKTKTSKSGVCPACEVSIPASSKFCPNCGEPIEQTIECPKCKEKISTKSKFCPECGEPLIKE